MVTDPYSRSLSANGERTQVGQASISGISHQSQLLVSACTRLFLACCVKSGVPALRGLQGSVMLGLQLGFVNVGQDQLRLVGWMFCVQVVPPDLRHTSLVSGLEQAGCVGESQRSHRTCVARV